MELNKKSSDSSKENRPSFPLEKVNRGQVYIDGGNVVFKAVEPYGSGGEVEMNEMTRIYAVVDQRKEALLGLLTPDRTVLVPADYAGFGDVFRNLSEHFNLDETLFLQTVHKKEEAKTLLWKKTLTPNYSIVADMPGDYTKGFEIQSPQKEFVSWDTPFNVLRDSEHTDFAFDKKFNALCFKYPVRVGRLLFDRLTAHNHYRDDIAVRFLLSNCYAWDASDNSYHDIFNRLSADLGRENLVDESRDESRGTFEFKVDGMRFCGEYQYDNIYNFENGYTKLYIRNQREYPALLINEPYESQMEVTDYVLLTNNLTLNVDYKYYSYPKRRPLLLNRLFGNRSVIWRDDANKKIGFADERFSIVLNCGDVKRLIIENLVPAKGAGGSTLIVELCKEGITSYGSLNAFKGKYRELNEYADAIQSVTQKEISSMEFSDC